MAYKMSWMYIAGFFDGEGCVSSSINNYGYRYYKIIMSQKPIKVLKIIKIFLLRHDIDSVIHIDSKTKCHKLTMKGRINNAMFLSSILPYLIVKKEQAEECLKWIKNCSEKGKLHITEKRKIRELRNSGLNYAQIGREIGRPLTTVQQYCKKESLLN